MIQVTSTISINEREIGETFIRSSGPGGQNVNKVSSKAVLRFDVRGSTALPERVRQRALTQLGSRLTSDGVLILQCSTSRDQSRNRAEVLERLRDLLVAATIAPRRRRPTRPSRGAVERRITAKKQRGSLKRERTRADD